MHTLKSCTSATTDFKYFESFTFTLPTQKDKVKWELDFSEYFPFFTSFCSCVHARASKVSLENKEKRPHRHVKASFKKERWF